MRQAIPGFQGFRPELPVQVYHQAMPHWRQDGATYFVTFRLGDSLPREKLNKLREFKNNWNKLHPEPNDETLDELAKQLFQRIEHWLDQGSGKCVLRQRAYAEILLAEMCSENGTNYELGCFVVMPNHVHAIVRPIKLPLEKITRSWKGRSAVQIHEQTSEVGPL